MKRIMLVVAYEGTAYSGWQEQPGQTTIESCLNSALSELLQEDIRVSGSSRTDSGVHALCNLAVFDTDTRMPGEKIALGVNRFLPRDISVRYSMEVAPDFHPRFVPTEKTYEYRIFISRTPQPLRRPFTLFHHGSLDVEAMRRGGEYLVGQHDFAAFCAAHSSAETTVRHVISLEIDTVLTEPCVGGLNDMAARLRDREIIIRVTGRGFLYNMVRIIAGTLIEVGRGALDPEDVGRILESRDRSQAGPTAPPQGLTLAGYRFIQGSV